MTAGFQATQSSSVRPAWARCLCRTIVSEAERRPCLPFERHSAISAAATSAGVSKPGFLFRICRYVLDALSPIIVRCGDLLGSRVGLLRYGIGMRVGWCAGHDRFPRWPFFNHGIGGLVPGPQDRTCRRSLQQRPAILRERISAASSGQSQALRRVSRTSRRRSETQPRSRRANKTDVAHRACALLSDGAVGLCRNADLAAAAVIPQW